MKFDPAVAVVKYHAALEARDFDMVERFLADDATYGSAGLGQIKGRDAIVKTMRTYFDLHPDHHSEDEAVVETAEFSARSRWRLRATHRLTGMKSERRGIENITFNNKGLIACIDVVDEALGNGK